MGFTSARAGSTLKCRCRQELRLCIGKRGILIAGCRQPLARTHDARGPLLIELKYEMTRDSEGPSFRSLWSHYPHLLCELRRRPHTIARIKRSSGTQVLRLVSHGMCERLLARARVVLGAMHVFRRVWHRQADARPGCRRWDGRRHICEYLIAESAERLGKFLQTPKMLQKSVAR
jgi:hypothetical protein